MSEKSDMKDHKKNPKNKSRVLGQLLKACQKLIEVVYPPLCLCCQQRTNHLRCLFCQSCLEHLTLLDQEHRCTRCFVQIEHTGMCRNCFSYHPSFKRHAAACENYGPPLALLTHLQRGEAALAKTIASLMVMQHNKLDWPIPDWIISCPTHLFPSFHLQGKLTRQVALETAKIFGRPYCNALKKSIDYAYFGALDSKQKPTRFSAALYKREDLSDKAILLVSLNSDQEERKQACEQLQGFFPKEIYSLSFLSSSN